ncbi:MAG: Asp-tRNA(Asn)/Glu-tRNA(Gln) amidotransferase subunit GatA [Candidatus Nanohalarchaeota archaeon]|nr:MAG: Asp-tRNA(Asn)/Glu-tRNA(Gln) amidotransferase subunit GatA [Candidatus Nanohaloarchaeota archaeon]
MKKSCLDFTKEVAEGKINLIDYYNNFYRQIDALKPLNYIITANPKENAIETAKDLSREIKKNKNILKEKPLLGIPITIKDCITTKNLRTTAGSKILDNYIPAFDATVVEKIKNAGGIIVGKTSMDEFGFGTFSTNCAYGAPKNPVDNHRSCGGSSGGACGFTAKIDMPHLAVAESTGGSISCPASFCGVFGITPTYGRVSRWGMIDYASSFDKIGSAASYLEDAVLLLNIISGIDEKDSTTVEIKKIVLDEKKQRNISLAIPKEYIDAIEDKNILEQFDRAKDVLLKKGVKIHEVSLKTTKYALSCYYIIAMAEASTNLAKYCGLRYGMQENPEQKHFDKYFTHIRTKYLGTEAKRRSIIGTYIRMAGFRDKYYLKAMQTRTLIIEDFKKIFKKYDAIFAPTMPIVAPKFSDIEKLSPKQNYSLDILTVGPNLAGFPTISIPFGKVENMPVGMQLIGDHLCEERIANIANLI